VSCSYAHFAEGLNCDIARDASAAVVSASNGRGACAGVHAPAAARGDRVHKRALSLNPNLAMAWALSAIAFAYMGDADEAERRHNRYKKLSPLDPHAFLYDAFFILITC